uniref:Uncharacterized protein n=1 Tax=viral metagenome TaxID=1070528 RepID=A0A6C0EJY2_9ZZZZ
MGLCESTTNEPECEYFSERYVGKFKYPSTNRWNEVVEDEIVHQNSNRAGYLIHGDVIYGDGSSKKIMLKEFQRSHCGSISYTNHLFLGVVGDWVGLYCAELSLGTFKPPTKKPDDFIPIIVYKNNEQESPWKGTCVRNKDKVAELLELVQSWENGRIIYQPSFSFSYTVIANRHQGAGKHTARRHYSSFKKKILQVIINRLNDPQFETKDDVEL